MSGGAEPALRLEGLSYAYRGSQAGVADVSLSVEPGAIYGLLGENGAGKTTLMRLMVGLLRPASGRILYVGSPLEEDRRAKLGSVGALIELPSLYQHLSGREHLRVFALYSGAPAGAVDRALDLTGLASAAGKLVKHYSLGMKQRLALATILLHDPRILILDEPTNGLDPSGIAEMRDLLRRLAGEGKAVIVSSHLLAEVEKIATRIGILDHGRLRFEGTPQQLSDHVRAGSRTILETSSPRRGAELLGAAGHSCAVEGDRLLLAGAGRAEVAEAIRLLVGEGIAVYAATPEAGSLERNFLSLSQGERP